MKFKFFLFLIPFFFCNKILNVDNIYIINNKNNFSIFFNIRNLNFTQKIVANNVLNIVLESKNHQEKIKNITFVCNFILSSINSEIICFLKEKISPNILGPFYFRIEYFKKSFIVKFKNENLKFTINLLEQIFYIGMIKSFRIKKNNVDFNYKISNVIIPISMSLNNDYIYPTIIAITSILENAYSYTKYDFYILYTSNFLKENKNKLKNFEKKYPNKCSINLKNMTNFKFKNAKLSGRMQSIATYYRLILPELLPNINKIIYLDGDTLILDDLKEMYDINMDNYYYKGFLDTGKDYFLPNNDNYICSGVLLINLENLRNDDIVNKMYLYMIKNNQNLYFHDQSIINDVCSEKIGILPAKFGIFNEKSLNSLYNITNLAYKNKKYRYSKKELRNAYFHPSILHCIIKPWKKNNYSRKIWLKFAEISNYYNEIRKKYNL
jgi:lipopolysaccharide biosynthesis glycosyltransferase